MSHSTVSGGPSINADGVPVCGVHKSWRDERAGTFGTTNEYGEHDVTASAALVVGATESESEINESLSEKIFGDKYDLKAISDLSEASGKNVEDVLVDYLLLDTIKNYTSNATSIAAETYLKESGYVGKTGMSHVDCGNTIVEFYGEHNFALEISYVEHPFVDAEVRAAVLALAWRDELTKNIVDDLFKVERRDVETESSNNGTNWDISELIRIGAHKDKNVKHTGTICNTVTPSSINGELMPLSYFKPTLKASHQLYQKIHDSKKYEVANLSLPEVCKLRREIDGYYATATQSLYFRKDIPKHNYEIPVVVSVDGVGSYVPYEEVLVAPTKDICEYLWSLSNEKVGKYADYLFKVTKPCKTRPADRYDPRIAASLVSSLDESMGFVESNPARTIPEVRFVDSGTKES